MDLLATLYPWIKALHLVAAVTFVSGALAAALVLSTTGGAGPVARAVVVRFRGWGRRVTTPAMVATWALGLGLGLAGHWFGSPWLIAKLAIVVVLSGVHGVLSARLRIVSTGGEPKPLGWPPLLVLGSAAAIVVLVIIKPA